MSKILLANITWNPFGWRNNNYINPKAGHQYAKQNVGGESLNFHFNKKSVDIPKFIYGFVQWTNNPIRFDNGGLIIFYTTNTDIKKGQIVGVYGKAEIFKAYKVKVPFQKQHYLTNVKAERDFSLFFPLPLDANNYKKTSGDRMVGQIGFTYKDENFAEKILFDELTELSKAGSNEKEFNKLIAIYELYIGKKFELPFISNNEKEQEQLEQFYKKNKTKKADILNDLKNIKDNDPEEGIVNHKAYKRDNKTIALIKILRDFKCQICSTTIMKKDGGHYVEAAHIKPKYQKGRETPDNIILLCPNHHKEFDLGKLEIKSHDIKQIVFVLNGQLHS
jgi:putative restriction endonuclease